MRLLIFLIPVFIFGVIYPQSVDTSTSSENEITHDSVISPQNDNVNADAIKPVTSHRKPVWLFLAFVFQFGLIGYLRLAFPKVLDEMIKGVMSFNIAQQFYRESGQSMSVWAMLYNINFILSGGIFLFLLSRHFGWKDDSLISMLYFLLAVMVIYSFKYSIMKLVSIIFPFGNIVEHYSFNFFLVQKIMGVALVPFNFLIAYGPEVLTEALIIIALIVIAVLVIGRSSRGLLIARNLIGQDAFHFFIYICTLEIAPVCILVKVVVDG